MKIILANKYYPLDCDEFLPYRIQDYYWPRNSYLNYFEEPYIPPLKEELHVKEYVKVKEKNIEIYEEFHEDLMIEEDSKIKINVEEINEDPSVDIKIFMMYLQLSN